MWFKKFNVLGFLSGLHLILCLLLSLCWRFCAPLFVERRHQVCQGWSEQLMTEKIMELPEERED